MFNIWSNQLLDYCTYVSIQIKEIGDASIDNVIYRNITDSG